MRAHFWRIAGLIEEHGLEHVREPHVKHLHDAIWEMRMKGRDGIARALYITATGRQVIVLRVFTKKTRKTPPKEIRLAVQREREHHDQGKGFA